MFGNSLFRVVGVAGVVAAVGTTKNINPEGHYSRCLSMPFDKPVLIKAEGLRTNGKKRFGTHGFTSPFVVSLSNHLPFAGASHFLPMAR